MADEPISALTLFTSYSTADEVEILDVSDTTFASTGTNKRIPFSTLLTMAGVGSGTGGGSGTVTSVGLSLPPFITVTGSPVSTSGTLTGTLATQTANTHFAGPTSGSAAAPTFRAFVPADLPVFVASGSSHAPGAVPDPGSTAGSTRYLREDATWDVPPSSGLTTGGAVTGGAANAILYENSSSNLAASSALTFNGTNTVSTTATALILQQTGDTTGTSYLQICNRATPMARSSKTRQSSSLTSPSRILRATRTTFDPVAVNLHPWLRKHCGESADGQHARHASHSVHAGGSTSLITESVTGRINNSVGHPRHGLCPLQFI